MRQLALSAKAATACASVQALQRSQSKLLLTVNDIGLLCHTASYAGSLNLPGSACQTGGAVPVLDEPENRRSSAWTAFLAGFLG